MLTINIQRLLCTVIKLHVVQEAIRSSSSLPFITNFNLFCKHKNINRLQSLFQGRNPVLLLSILSGVRLIEVVKIAQCLLTINIQRLLCTLIKFKKLSRAQVHYLSLPTLICFVNTKTLTDFSPYFKDVIQYYYCQFCPVSA